MDIETDNKHINNSLWINNFLLMKSNPF